MADADTTQSRLFRRLGQRCRALRTERGLSQMDMVRHFEISLSHYQKIERGVLDCRLSTLHRLAEAFEVTLAQLLEDV
jgi:transcriptional regulator with XRE-family HTH domain